MICWPPRTPSSTVPSGASGLGGGLPGSELVQHDKTLVRGKPALVEYRHLVDDPAGFLVLRPDGYVAASGKLAAQLGHVWQQLESVVRDAKPAN